QGSQFPGGSEHRHVSPDPQRNGLRSLLSEAGAAATRVLALFRFLCFSGLPPLFGTRGASVAWETNCFSVGKRLKSGPYSLSTTSTVSTPIASICVTSTPLIRYKA